MEELVGEDKQQEEEGEKELGEGGGPNESKYVEWQGGQLVLSPKVPRPLEMISI